MHGTSWQSDQGFRLTRAILSHYHGIELEAWSDKNPQTMSDPWGVALSSVHHGRLLRVGGPRQGLITLLDSYDDMKHTRLAHAQGGLPCGIMKGGTSASSNRASDSGIGIVS